jgi:hypothetical protein
MADARGYRDCEHEYEYEYEHEYEHERDHANANANADADAHAHANANAYGHARDPAFERDSQTARRRPRSPQMTRALLVAIAALTLTLPAAAQTDPVAAQALFDEAKRLMASGNAAAACPKLAESQRLDPGVGTLLNLGECYESIGKLARAWATFREAEAMAFHEGQLARANWAKGRAAQLETKLVQLTVDVPEAARVPSLEVVRDGEVLREPLWGSAVPVDPGDHVVEARAPGYKPFSTHVTAAHDPIVVRIEPLEHEATAPEPPPPAIDTTPPVTIETLPPEPKPIEPSATLRNLGFVTGGVGLAGVGLGALFGVLAIDRDNAARGAGCDTTTCPTPGALAISQDAKSFAVASDVAFAVGGVLVATGIVFLVVAPRSPAVLVGGTF